MSKDILDVIAILLPFGTSALFLWALVFGANAPRYECPPQTETEKTSSLCLYCEKVDTLNKCAVVEPNVVGKMGYDNLATIMSSVMIVGGLLMGTYLLVGEVSHTPKMSARGVLILCSLVFTLISVAMFNTGEMIAKKPLYECPPMTTRSADTTPGLCLYCEEVEALTFKTCNLVVANVVGTWGYSDPLAIIFFVLSALSFVLAMTTLLGAVKGEATAKQVVMEE